MSEPYRKFRNFVAQILEHEGALVEPIEPEGLEVLLPLQLQETLRAKEMMRFGFSNELPRGAERLSLESDWLERFGNVLDKRGRDVRFILDVPSYSLTDPERIIERGLTLQNAVYRLSKTQTAWTRYAVFLFHYTAISDEKREGIVPLCINLATKSTIDIFVQDFVAAIINEESKPEKFVPPDTKLPDDWDEKRLKKFVSRALPSRVQSHLTQFLQGTQRRIGRDLARLYDYYSSLRNEAWTRMQKGVKDSAREQLRIEAAARDYESKVVDLKQKYALNVEVELNQKFELIMPVQRIYLLVKRRKAERKIALDWNPLARKLEPPMCEWSFSPTTIRVVCDDALHITIPEAQAPCRECGKEFCRLCNSTKCPKCQHPTNEE
jgi:hypothetical protein